MTAFRVEITLEQGVVLARLEGELDFSNTADCGERIISAVSNDAAGLVIDLDAVRYIDSAGVRMLFEIARQLEACRQATGIVLAEESPIRRLVEVTHLAEAVLVCNSVEECIEGLHRGAQDRI